MYRKYYNPGTGTGYGPGFGKYGSPFNAEFWEGLRGGFFRRPKYNVPLNIVDNATNYEVYVYALGFDKENIKISVEDDVLFIRGTRTVDKDNLPVFRRQEYPIKSFERVVSLYGQVDTTQIKARHENGILIITLPKKPEAQQSGQEIPID